MKLQEVAQQVQMTKRAIKYYEEDVYKRQVQHSLDGEALREQKQLMDAHTPVSYTHLDVYKRQRHSCAAIKNITRHRKM